MDSSEVDLRKLRVLEFCRAGCSERRSGVNESNGVWSGGLGTGDESKDGAACPSFWKELPKELQNGDFWLEMKPLGMGMDGKALVSFFNAFSLIEDERRDLAWKTAAIEETLGGDGSTMVNSLGPACHGAGITSGGAGCSLGGQRDLTPAAGVALSDELVELDMLSWSMEAIEGRSSTRLLTTSKSPPPGSWSIAAVFSAAGVFGEVRRVATGLMAGWMNE